MTDLRNRVHQNFTDDRGSQIRWPHRIIRAKPCIAQCLCMLIHRSQGPYARNYIFEPTVVFVVENRNHDCGELFIGHLRDCALVVALGDREDGVPIAYHRREELRPDIATRTLHVGRNAGTDPGGEVTSL